MGWTVHGVHSVYPNLVIVHVIGQDGVTIPEGKNQSPVPADPYREVSLQGSVEWVQFPSRYAHVARGFGGIQAGPVAVRSWRHGPAESLPCYQIHRKLAGPCNATDINIQWRNQD